MSFLDRQSLSRALLMAQLEVLNWCEEDLRSEPRAFTNLLDYLDKAKRLAKKIRKGETNEG